MVKPIVSLRASIVEAAKVLCGEDDLTISLEPSGSELMLGFNDPTLPSVALAESLTDILVNLGDKVAEQLKAEAEDRRDSFKDVFRSELSEITEAIESDDVEEWENILDNIINAAKKAKQHINTEHLDEAADYENAAEALEEKLKEFQCSQECFDLSAKFSE